MKYDECQNQNHLSENNIVELLYSVTWLSFEDLNYIHMIFNKSYKDLFKMA